MSGRSWSRKPNDSNWPRKSESWTRASMIAPKLRSKSRLSNFSKSARSIKSKSMVGSRSPSRLKSSAGRRPNMALATPVPLSMVNSEMLKWPSPISMSSSALNTSLSGSKSKSLAMAWTEKSCGTRPTPNKPCRSASSAAWMAALMSKAKSARFRLPMVTGTLTVIFIPSSVGLSLVNVMSNPATPKLKVEIAFDTSEAVKGFPKSARSITTFGVDPRLIRVLMSGVVVTVKSR